MGEGREAVESRVERREEGKEERVIGPVRGGGEGGKRGAEGSEFGVEDLPSASEGFDGKRGKKEEGKEAVD